MVKASQTILEINLNALKHNYSYLKSKVNKDTLFMGVVKAFAYGGDPVEISKTLVACGVNYLAVAYTEEGLTLRKAGIKTPILVLHPQAVNFKILTDNDLEPNLYSLNLLTHFLKFSEEENFKGYPIHLKFNTGLNRLGFKETDIDLISKKLKNNVSVKVRSVFSHLAASEDLKEMDFTKQQLKRFAEISKALPTALGYTPLLHVLNTSGILNYPEAQYNMVRSGIGLSGYGNSEIENKALKPIASLKTVISQIHHLEQGETVGYNRAFKAEQPTKIATLPLGHADGISRAYGNKKGSVSINGQAAYIVGNVCMDMLMVDVTHLSCQEGDEVILFGASPNAETFSNAVNSISYEILTAISQRIKRVFSYD